MVDSNTVLWGQAIVYSVYAAAVLSVVAWFGYRITRPGRSTAVRPRYFYAWIALLTVVGVSLHLTTLNTIPWVRTDLEANYAAADRTFAITAANHAFTLPADKLRIACNELVLFDVTSTDLTYGFGLFRQDHSMVFQMQVVPGHRNALLWTFAKDGVYDIRSTEYSGPAGARMVVDDAVEVSGCGSST